ncbi:MAG TPA: LON peptidase substrate-binding domain-containing protein [Vicinamibacterales bacterium]|nr:LON peptidase substrate-binding domain-containing protein [Vicinamibacterales bacterium]
MLPPVIPLFPLPNVVLFPNVQLPLHIFEPRYRAMLADALARDRLIGMVLLRPGWEADYEGRPPIFPVGCAGVVTHAERLPDGRANIVLRGVQKFHVEGEQPGRPYRLAVVRPIAETLGEGDRERLRELWPRLERLVFARVTAPGARRLPEDLPGPDVVNALAQYLDLDPLERQALLECDGPLARCRLLIDLLEMKLLAPGRAGGVH